MNELKIFENREFGKMRTVTVDNELWFVGKDVAEILGYQNGSRDINAHVDEEDRLKYQISTAGQMREQTLINESGLYSLILSSKLPKAKEFKHWVTSEVLPSIRKTGGYIAGQEDMSDDELMAKALLVAQRQIEERNKLIETMRPKALFADAVATSKTSILVGELAKILKQNGVDMGQRRLFAWLRDNGYLMKRGSDYNMPTQRAMEMRLFEIKETPVNNPDGSVRVNKTTKVTGRGQNYFVNRFLGASQE